MISKAIKYTIFILCIGLLITGNIIIHIAGMNLSEESLRFEKDISTLKQANQRLESEMLAQSSLQTVAAFAASEGYYSSGPAIRWMEPVIAAR